MNSQKLSNNDQIEKFTVSLADIENRRKKARRIFNFAVKNLSGTGDEDIIYTNLYDSIRMGCEIVLWLSGYRAKKSSEGYHYITINAAGELLNGDMSNEFQRIQKMRQKRNRFDYGTLASISEAELKQAMNDARVLLNKIDDLIKSKEN
ncbi:MAG: hypothetical protein NTY31_01495 [Candidatus Falkowbacteria bacterium]|nr:hypothetical protein [Candidatus Falkowbacteria bacterium]